LFDSRDAAGRGIALVTGERFNLQLIVSDGTSRFAAESDYGTHPGTLAVGAWQHVAIIADGGPRIVSFVVDGELNDGGATRQFGWTRIASELDNLSGPNGATTARIAPAVLGEVGVVRFYNRYLTTSEAVGNWRAGS
ncbi:MAG: hypothetical protein H7039_04390, partial [Bryobacteraceae bacterium]|nr:hypothetical protein [Bryobacteraceae bacterium]